MRNKSLYIYLSVTALVLVFFGVFLWVSNDSEANSKEVELTDSDANNPDLIVNGIHVRTGLVEGEGLTEVITNCTTCHSSKLIIQNRMGTEQWNATIRWMQETQGLWDLGENQDIIVDYLTTNYPTFKKGRRAALTDIEWYPLDSK
ncbi:monoheme cytochrome C [Maribacter sp. 4G9]|uniref:monoheme cytochrome C n=1 Tax=Maribacter sp. 4G9 TaxID=1889777 RepID=UPI000C15A5B0|nr:monoheme cytochrome C [Maribacter sp. 4G9]PIB38945.1 hypothetical protein BFP75_13810 [Maribacter sp. 4G9]